jgi:type II secretory pathway predicted ATPase ExeA
MPVMPNGSFGLNEDPFVEGHAARFVYPSRAHRVIVTRLRHAIENREPFVLVTGLPGVGKTIAVQAALAEAGPHTVVLITASPSLSHATFRERILSGLAQDASDTATPARSADGIEARLLAARARGRLALLVVDEAQHLGPPLLEELRVLSDLEADGRPLLQIILTGQPKLEEALSRPGCDALRQRIAVRCRLGSLSAEETEGYIRHRVSAAGGDSQSLFTSESCRTVHRLAHGIPREINLVAGEALTLAHAAGESAVAAGHIAGAAVLLGFRSVVEEPPPTKQAAKPVAVDPVEVVPFADDSSGLGECDVPEPGLPVVRDFSLPAWCDAPLAAHAAEPPAGKAEIPSPAPAGNPPPPPSQPVDIAVKATPAPLESPEVEEWLARFRGPDGPPRIGSRLAVAPTVSEALDPCTDAAAAADGQPAVLSPPQHARSRRRTMLRPRSSRSAHTWSTATWTVGALLLMATAGLVLVNSGRSFVRPRPSTRAAMETTVERVDRTRTLSASVARPTLVRVPPPTAPRRSPVRPAAASPPASAGARPAPAPPARSYGVEVASFIVESRAIEERDRLAARLSRPCSIVTSHEDGAQVYSIVVGPVASSEEAARLSEDLSERGLVGQARVVRWAVSDSTRR